MKTEHKLILGIFAVIIIFGIGAFIGVKLQPQPEIPTYSTTDSLEMVRIDSVKGEYQQVIDSLTKSVKTRYVKIIEYRNTADSFEVNADSICLPVIIAKNKLISELDSTVFELDREARTYSDMLYLLQRKDTLQIKRFKRLSFEMDSITVLYSDSLTNVNKRLYSKFFKRNGLWNKNEFRNYVMKPIEK